MLCRCKKGNILLVPHFALQVLCFFLKAVVVAEPTQRGLLACLTPRDLRRGSPKGKMCISAWMPPLLL